MGGISGEADKEVDILAVCEQLQGVGLQKWLYLTNHQSD